MCKKIMIFLLPLVVTSACGRPSGISGDVLLPISKTTESSENPKATNLKDQGNNTAKAQPAPSSNQPTPIATPLAAVVSMTLEEAKAKCAMCHQPGGPGAGVWSTANGSESDWKAFAKLAKSSVVAGRMPKGIPMSPSERSSFIAFLDLLLGISPGQPSDKAKLPEPQTFSFEFARTMCVGCHSSTKQEPVLETLEQWRDEKEEIEKEVRRGRMPYGKRLTSEERTALLNFIQRL